MKTARISFAVFAGCFFAGMWLAFHFVSANLIVAAVFVLVALLLHGRAQLISAAAYAAAAALLVSAAVGGVSALRSNRLVLQYGGKEVTFSAMAEEIFLQEENQFGVLLTGCCLPGGENCSAVVYGFGDFDCREGETVLVTATIEEYLPTDAQRGRGADLVAVMRTLDRIEEPSGLRNSINDLYNYLKINITSNILGEESDLFSAIFLGDREQLPEKSEDLFRRSGISHLLCISGLHLILLASLLRLLLYPVFGRLPVREIPVFLLILGYLFCIGFPPAACRAALLLCFSAVGKLFYRKGDSLMILSVSVVLMLLTEPKLANSLSFQLSVASVAGLELLEPKLRAVFFADEAVGRRFSFLTVSLSAAIAVFPWSALVFGYFSFGGIFASLLAVPLMTPILASGLLAALFGGTVGGFFGSICRVLLLCVKALAEAFSFGSLPLRDGFVLCGVLFAAGSLLLGIFLGKRKTAACFSAVLFALSLFLSTAYRQNHLTVVQFQGEDSVVLSISRGRSAVIIGMGSGMEEEITGYLRGHGIDRVDCLILPDSSRSGSGDTWDFAQKNKVSRIMAEKSNRYASQPAERTEFLELSPGYYEIFGETLEIRQGKHGFLLDFSEGERQIILLPKDWAVPQHQAETIFY